MGYLIQNLVHTNYTLRLNLRIRSTWLLRNYFVIYLLILSSTHINNFMSTSLKDVSFWLRLNKYLFARFAKIVCMSANYLKQVTFGINFPNTAHYIACTRILHHISYAQISDRTWLNTHVLYNTPIAIVTTPRVRTLLRCTLYYVFKYWLNTWVPMPNSYTLPHSFVCMSVWWQLITFTNAFYFKVYNT